LCLGLFNDALLKPSYITVVWSMKEVAVTYLKELFWHLSGEEISVRKAALRVEVWTLDSSNRKQEC
jgi:hypothetical protein